MNVARDKVITVTFCEPIKTGTMWIELFNTIGTKTLVLITTSVSGNLLTINHSVLLVNGTRYTLALHTGSVTDLAGNNLIGVSCCFTTLIQTITNINTGNHYSTIQAAINDLLTVDGNVILVSNGTYIENIVVNKSLTLLFEGDVTVQTANSSRSVFTIDLHGIGSAIQGFKIIGATCCPGILLDSAQNCTIMGNSLAHSNGIVLLNSNYNLLWGNNLDGDNSAGITLNNSSNNTMYENIVSRIIDGDGIILQYYSVNNSLFGNDIENNCGSGICILTKSSAQICGNNVKNNGIFISNSANNIIYENYITHEYNGETAISLYNSSAEIHFNQISGKFTYGLKVSNNSTVNATNNWWGTNTVSYIKSTSTPSTSYNIWNKNSTVFYNTWLVLNLKGSVIHVTHNSTSSSEITADITHNNQGEDTSSSGTIPDGLPVNFTTTMGTITPTATNRKGKATVTLTSSPFSGATTVTASTYNQTVSKVFRKSFSTIQAAISNSLTVDGDVIVVENGTYTENIFVNKNLKLISEGNVTVQASNPSNPVIYIYKWGSGAVIAYFKLINATNSCGIYLSSATNCTIYSNTITGNFNGIVLHLNANGNTILNNTILNNKNVGIGLDYSNNNTLTKNNVSYNWVGTSSLDSYNNIISRNKLYRNGLYGVYMDASNDEILENSITYNICGIGLYRSATSQIHFNQIFGNTYGLFANGTSVMVNVTNNWWGHENNSPRVAFTDTPADIIIYNGNVVYDPWLILTVYPTSYKVANGKIYEATITADLTYNSDGTDTSIQGRVPDGIPVYFHAQYGTNTFQQLQYSLNGKASTNLVRDPNYHDVIFVMGAVDGDYNFTGVDWIAKAVINVMGSAVNASNTNQKLNLTYEIPLNDPTIWVSVLWKETSLYHGEVDLIVNGVVVKSCNVVNAAYLTYHFSYSEEVFKQIKFVNSLFLNPVGSTTFVPNQYLQPLIDYYHLENMTFDQLENSILMLVKIKNNFTDNEIAFIKNHRLEFIDMVGFVMAYPGDAIQTISFVDPDNNQTLSINFPGNPILRMSPMIYYDGYMEDTNGTQYDVGYEGVRSFAIATTKVTNSVVQYWLDKQSLYAPGAMKAAYGTFLTSLLVIKCHDMVADQAATAYNVTWSRTTPVVVSCCDDAASSYITGEMDFRMGMDVNGTVGNVWSFRFACSSAFSPIEQQVGSPDGAIGSVTMGIGERILNGETPELFYSNGQIVYKIKDKDDLILMVDPVTGIVRDAGTDVCGVYCYHNQITNQVIERAQNIVSSDPNVQPKWTDAVINSTIPLGSIIAGVGEVAYGAATPSTAFIGYFAPVLLPLVTIQLLDSLRPGAIEEAESNGSFNTAEYFRNNNSWDITWDVMLQSIGMGGPPKEVFDESDEYIRNNENVKRNLQDIKNLKESALAVWNGLYDNLSCPYDRYRYEKAKLEWEEEYDTALSQPPTDPLGQFLVKLVKKSVKKCDSGITKIKEGDIVGGAIDLALGTAGFDIVTATIIYEAWPKKPEVPGNNSTK